MPDTIKELKIICQKEGYQDWGLLVNSLYRPISWFFVRYLVQTSISANQVTLISIIIGIIGSLCFLSSNLLSSLCGSILLFFWYVGECCDGSVARYRNVKEGKAFTKFGRYIDWFNIRITTNTLFLCITMNAFWESNSYIVLFVGLFIIFIWDVINVLSNLIRFFITGGGMSTVRPDIVNDSSILEKMRYYLVVLWVPAAIPLWFFASTLINVLLDYLGINIIVYSVELNIIFITYSFLGVIYTLYFIINGILSIVPEA